MPRRKQQNPQPVKLDSEDGLGINTSASLTFEGNFLLNENLDFSDHNDDRKIIGLERFSGCSLVCIDESCKLDQMMAATK